MKQQKSNAAGEQTGRWADQPKGKLPAASSPASRSTKYPLAQLSIYLFIFLAVSSASAQVPSHSPAAFAQPSTTDVAVIQPVGRPVVRVNGEELTDRDLLREMLSIFPYARVHNGFPKAMEPDIRNGAMKMIVFEELVYQEAKRRNMSVPPGQLARALLEFRGQFPSPKDYQQFLQAEFQGSQKLLQSKVERSLLIDELLKQEVGSKATATAAEARAFYDQHPERFRTPESFSFQSVSFLPPRNATTAQLQEVRKRAQEALRQAKATHSYEEFGVLAEKVSEDDFRVMMGEHKAADRSKLPPVIVSALLALQPGQVSGIIEFDPNACTILRLGAHLPAGAQKFESIKDALREQLEKQKTEQLRSALAAKLSKNAKIEKL
jgi:hypothetical protein